MTGKRKLLAAASSVALAVFATSADAAVLIQGTGFWTGSATTTAVSAPNRSFQFSFDLPDTITKAAGYAFTSAISNFSFSLDGHVLSAVPAEIRFYSSGNNGLFDMVLNGINLRLFGADVGSNGTLGPTGAYNFTSAVNGDAPAGLGFVTVTSIAAAVPEPAVWGLMIVGFGMIGSALRYRRRQQTEVRFG
ncbi:MAG: PEPxxWA-CTERM sorting domain-containing protein [Sphingomonas sp.]|nr:PEPxxWA-CTERM sorting domain-containing protein [Sphingomonas sp.]